MNDSENINGLFRYTEYGAVMLVNKMPVAGPQDFIFRNQGTPLWKLFKGRNLTFQLGDKCSSVRRAVGSDISENLLYIPLC